MADNDSDSLLDMIDRAIRARQDLIDARERTRWARQESVHAMKRAGSTPTPDRRLAGRARARSERVRERADERARLAGGSATDEGRDRHEQSVITHEMHATAIDELAAANEHGDEGQRVDRTD